MENADRKENIRRMFKKYLKNQKPKPKEERKLIIKDEDKKVVLKEKAPIPIPVADTPQRHQRAKEVVKVKKSEEAEPTKTATKKPRKKTSDSKDNTKEDDENDSTRETDGTGDEKNDKAPKYKDVTKVKRIEEENEEVFEEIKGARPARCNPKKKARKLKWKEEGKEEEEDKSNDNAGDDRNEMSLMKNPTKQTKKSDNKKPGIDNSLDNKKNAAPPNVVESGVKVDKRPSLDKGKGEKHGKKKKRLVSVATTQEDEEDEAYRHVGFRVTEVIKRNQLFERVLTHSECTVLGQFFRSKTKKPDDTICMILDKAITSALDYIASRSHEMDDVIDNQMRLFVMDQSKAKPVILDLMISHPELVPVVWGGRDVKLKDRHEATASTHQKPTASVMRNVEDPNTKTSPSPSNNNNNNNNDAHVYAKLVQSFPLNAPYG